MPSRRLGAEVRATGHPAEVDERQVDLAAAEQLEHLLGVGLAQHDPDPGVVGVKPREQRGEPALEQGLQRAAEAHRAAAELGVGGELLVGVVDLGEDALRARQEIATGLGQPDRAVAALDQHDPELELERAQPLRQRRLGHAESARGVGEAPGVGDRDERAELADLHDNEIVSRYRFSILDLHGAARQGERGGPPP